MSHNANELTVKEQNKSSSYLDMTGGDGYVMYGKMIIVSIVTVGILFPMAYYHYINKLCEHTYIDGRKCTFSGKMKDVYIICIIGVLAIVALLVIEYLLKMAITQETELNWIHKGIGLLTSLIASVGIKSNLMKWHYSNMHFATEDDTTPNVNCDADSDDERNADTDVDKYKPPQSVVKMDLVRSFEVSLVKSFLNVITAYIAYPYTFFLYTDYTINRVIIDGEQLVFTGKRRTVVGIYFPYFIATICTLGLFIPYLTYKMTSWKINNMHMASLGEYKGRRKTWLEKVFSDRVSNIAGSVLDWANDKWENIKTGRKHNRSDT